MYWFFGSKKKDIPKEKPIRQILKEIQDINIVVNNVYLHMLKQFVTVLKEEEDTLQIQIKVPMKMVGSPHLLTAIMKKVEETLEDTE